jgi:hypothetical protein
MVTAEEVAEALTAGDNDLDDELGGWLSFQRTGAALSIEFEDAETHTRSRFYAVVTPVDEVG